MLLPGCRCCAVCFGGIQTLPDSIEVDLVGYESFYGNVAYSYHYQPAALSGRYSLTRIPSSAVSIYDGQEVKYRYVSPFSFSIEFSCVLYLGTFYLYTAFELGPRVTYSGPGRDTSESYMSSGSWTGSDVPQGFDPSPHPGWFATYAGARIENECRIRGQPSDVRFNKASSADYLNINATTTSQLSAGGVLPLLCVSEIGQSFPLIYDGLSSYTLRRRQGNSTYHYYQKSWSITAIDFIVAGEAIPAFLTGI